MSFKFDFIKHNFEVHKKANYLLYNHPPNHTFTYLVRTQTHLLAQYKQYKSLVVVFHFRNRVLAKAYSDESRYHPRQ